MCDVAGPPRGRTGRVAAARASTGARAGSRAARAHARARYPRALSRAAPRDRVLLCSYGEYADHTARALNRLHGRLHTPRSQSHTRARVHPPCMHRPSPYARTARHRPPTAPGTQVRGLGAYTLLGRCRTSAARQRVQGAQRDWERGLARGWTARVREAHAEHARRLLAGHLAVAVAIRAVEQLHRAALATGGKGGGISWSRANCPETR